MTLLLTTTSRVAPCDDDAIGVYLGAGAFVAPLYGTREDRKLSAHTGTAGALSIASGRISHTLGFTGPALSLDTACSSWLVAAHVAANAVLVKECSLALVAGVGFLLHEVS